VYIDFKILKVKVLMIFFGTPVFSARRDGRYITLYNVRPYMADNLVY
jgi:hypothetical protein